MVSIVLFPGGKVWSADLHMIHTPTGGLTEGLRMKHEAIHNSSAIPPDVFFLNVPHMLFPFSPAPLPLPLSAVVAPRPLLPLPPPLP